MSYDHITDLFRAKLHAQYSHIRSWDFQLLILGTFQFKTKRGNKPLLLNSVCVTWEQLQFMGILPFSPIMTSIVASFSFLAKPRFKKKKILGFSLPMYIYQKEKVSVFFQEQKNIYTYNQYRNQCWFTCSGNLAFSLFHSLCYLAISFLQEFP